MLFSVTPISDTRAVNHPTVTGAFVAIPFILGG